MTTHARALPSLLACLLALSCGGSGKDGEGGTDTCDEVTVYDDLDKDGFGNPNSGRLGCADDRGVVLNGDDCLDTDPRVFPLNPELCINGIDEDCDGVADDGCHVEWCGEITEDAVWEGKFIHDLTCDVSIGGAGSPTVVIEDGAQVFAEEGVAIRVGASAPGRLAVEGGDLGLFLDPSDEGAPWEGIFIGPEGSGSTIAGAFIRDARAPLVVDGAEVDVTGTTIERAVAEGVQLLGAARLRMSDSVVRDGQDDGVVGQGNACLDGTATFTGNTIEGNAGAPVRQPTQCYRALDASSSYTGNGDDTIHLSDNIYESGAEASGDHPWQDLGVPVVADLERWFLGDDAATLTFEGGLDVTWLGEHAGPRNFLTIDADGSADRITMQGGEFSAWGGTLRGVDFERAGSIMMGAGTLEDVVVRDATPASGSYAAGADRLIDVDIIDCRGIGLKLDESFAYMENVRVTGCTGRVADVALEAVEHFDPNSSFTGNADDGIVIGRILTGRDLELTQSAVWPAVDVQYRLADTLIIGGDGAAEEDVTLTLSDGMDLVVNGYLEEDYDEYSHSLIIDGHTLGVDIESRGLVVGHGDETSIVGLRHEGGKKALDLRREGVYIRDTTLAGFTEYGVWGHIPDMQGSTLRDGHADSKALMLWDEDMSTFTGNTLIDTPHIGQLYLDAVGLLQANNDLSGTLGSPIQVRGTLTTTATWAADFAYEGDAAIAPGAHLTLEPGVEWAVYNQIETTSGGTLTAIGTPSAPIVFTSWQAAPAAGDWIGLTLHGGSTLQHAEVAYAGETESWRTPEQVGIELRGAATVTDTTIRDTRGWCISRANTAAQSATISSNTYDCLSGDEY
jgi:hypothetical protein